MVVLLYGTTSCAAEPSESMGAGSLPPFPATWSIDVPSGSGTGNSTLSDRLATLDQAIEITLQRNPTLVAQRQQDPVSRAALEVAATYPYNPVAQAQVLPLSRDRDGNPTSTFNTWTLVETIELAHQQRHRIDAATAELARSGWSIRQAELAQVAQTQRLYFTVVYRHDLRDTTTAQAGLDAEIVGILQRRFSAGQSTATEVALARINARTSRQEADMAAASYENARLELQTQLGLPQSAAIDPCGETACWKWQPVPVAALAGEASGLDPGRPQTLTAAALVVRRPDVMQARAELCAACAQLDLAQANRVPNVQLGPAFERDESGTAMFGVQAQMELPIVNNGRALVRQREAEVGQREVALQQLLVQAQSEAEAAIAHYERVRAVLEKSRSELGGAMAQDVRWIEDSFRAGQTDLIHVHTAHRNAIDTEKALLGEANDLAQAAARVTETTGIAPRVLVYYSCPEPPRPAK
jgi:cobalt-zinc-cadmium efflux system outer membrane protein